MGFVLLVFASVRISLGGSPASGFYSVRGENGRWQLISPTGEPFFVTGVSCVSYRGYTIYGTKVAPYTMAVAKKYGSRNAWAQATTNNLAAWGFNTLGAWSDNDLAGRNVGGHHLAYTPILDLGAGFAGRAMGGPGWAWMEGVFPDVFDRNFEVYCRTEAEKKCRPLRRDPNLLGWFVDNELRWGPDGNSPDELLVTFLNLNAHAPGREAALALLHWRYPQIAHFNQVWGTSFSSWQEATGAPRFAAPAGVSRPAVFVQNETAGRSASTPQARAFLEDCDIFLGVLARKYFQVTHDAIESADSNHLLLGCRFATIPARPVIQAAAQYEDVISFNCYQSIPTSELDIYAREHKPLLISEFTFRGHDSVCPNTKGAGPVVATQQDRAAGFVSYAKAAMAHPNLVGYIWFDFADEPKEGRFDGENSNYGLVDINDRPYAALVDAVAGINQHAQQVFLQPAK